MRTNTLKWGSLSVKEVMNHAKFIQIKSYGLLLENVS